MPSFCVLVGATQRLGLEPAAMPAVRSVAIGAIMEPRTAMGFDLARCPSR
jgi:hypothetical protein